MNPTSLRTSTIEVGWGSGLRALSILTVWPYNGTMIKTTNPYKQILLQKGYSLREIRETKSTTTKTFPMTIHGRTFQTEVEYLDDLHEFLNGNWSWLTKIFWSNSWCLTNLNSKRKWQCSMLTTKNTMPSGLRNVPSTMSTLQSFPTQTASHEFTLKGRTTPTRSIQSSSLPSRIPRREWRMGPGMPG